MQPLICPFAAYYVADTEAPNQAARAQVRDYSFSPDSGRVDALRYDALGLPAIPEAVLTVLEARPCLQAPCTELLCPTSGDSWHGSGCLVWLCKRVHSLMRVRTIAHFARLSLLATAGCGRQVDAGVLAALAIRKAFSCMPNRSEKRLQTDCRVGQIGAEAVVRSERWRLTLW